MADRRMFFALWPGEPVRDELISRVDADTSIRGRRHVPGDLHMTLVFLGNVKAEQLSCIEQVAADVDARSFELQIDHTGYWSRPKIVWAAPDVMPQPLAQLVKDLQQGLKSCGFEPEKRPYRPHVTLFRKAQKLAPGRIEPVIPWRVREFVLAASAPPGEGDGRYRIMQRWPMRDDD